MIRGLYVRNYTIENSIQRAFTGPNRHREACKYNFQDPDPMSKKAAHFTQLVWGASKQLGVGVAAAKNAEKNCIYVVARYKPMEALKTKEQLKTNVKKGLFDASIDCAATSKKKFFIAV
ncbi:unnamed protein product [Pocillopora meandrina]|uniref:SCP domain-containing protein n=1 Tax=Pocillopora meandrina TaxID=46732 RepID=A0AAU9W0V4_9CNID|nr:unnamed protein product [Pocillopora meandrina]